MYKCPKCGKELKTTQGLRGHMNFVHGHCEQTSAILKIKQVVEDRIAHKNRQIQIKDQITVNSHLSKSYSGPQSPFKECPNCTAPVLEDQFICWYCGYSF